MSPELPKIPLEQFIGVGIDAHVQKLILERFGS